MKLKLFSEQNALPEITHEAILYPFWGKPLENSTSLSSGIFDKYIEQGNSFFEMTSLESADLAVVPHNWEPVFGYERQALSVRFIEKAKQKGKLSVSFFGGDRSHLELPIACDLVFRNSLYRGVKDTDFAMPAWSEDFVKEYLDNQLLVRQKKSKPTVGFCGFAATRDWKTYLKLLLYQGRRIIKSQNLYPPNHTGHILRFQALRVLSSSPMIETNFNERERLVFFNESNLNVQKRFRMEFVKNMIDSDYILCCRGSGNYSFRFYEALCCGRIPVFIDTDCVLPYDFEIDWKKYCVWVDESELLLIADKIAEFHEKISPQEFVDLQHECRKIWEQRISPEGFFANLYLHLNKNLHCSEYHANPAPIY